MPTKEDLKKRVSDSIEKRSKEITEIGETVLRNPELGYKEVKTASLVEEKFRSLGLSYRKGTGADRAPRPGPRQSPGSSGWRSWESSIPSASPSILSPTP